MDRTKPPPNYRLRPGALLVGGVINVVGALLVLFAMPGHASDERLAAAWALIQFLTGVWTGVLGANSPFFSGLVAAIPAVALGLLITSALPPQFVIVAWFIAPAAALLAAALIRFMRRRTGSDPIS